jgi:uncharacterized cupredoxin-like copper-binding protein
METHAPIDLARPDDDPPTGGRDSAFAIAIVVALLAMVGAVVAVAMGWRAVDESRAGGGGGGAAATTASVSMTEFAITPAQVSVGGSLAVSNDGSVPHNLAIEGTDLITADLSGGESEELGIGGLSAGTYTMFCDIPGHRDAGMEAELTVAEGGTPVASDGESAHGGHGDMDYQAMTDAMVDSITAFPAETEGSGNQLLEPTEVLADGTKVFDLTMEPAKWEIEPGKLVDAFTFNGMVPGPMMKLEVGDKVQVRVQNDLPMATDVHWHGLNVTNANDGVAPITQPLIEPGDTYTYDFVTDEQAVAMYHPHAHGHFLLPDGMFGVVVVGDVRLPRGQTVGLEQIPADLELAAEIPMVLNDAGAIGYSLNGKSFPATEPYVFEQGDWILVHYYNEGTQIHPMHLHQFDQIVVAKDGYPLDFPYTADTVNVAPGERFSVLVQLDAPGTWVWHCHILNHVERAEGMFGMVTAVIVQ